MSERLNESILFCGRVLNEKGRASLVPIGFYISDREQDPK